MAQPWFQSLIIPLGWFAAVAMASYGATGAVLRLLQRRAILDHPNPRSSHDTPTPRGGGIAILAVLLPVWAALAVLSGAPQLGPIRLDAWVLFGAAIVLGAVSWADDLRGLAPWLRLGLHFVAVAMVLATFDRDHLVFQGLLPWALDRIAAGLIWVWFINLFNFMDGIDGIAGIETITIGFGLFLLAPLAIGGEGTLFGLTIAAAALGFLKWNWHPARVFLGDVGSVPLGLLLGWLLLDAAAAGHWAAAIILPLYYLADATITILRRLLRGERIWRAHAEHFYQAAVQRGLSHGWVAGIILAANIILIAFAVIAEAGIEIVGLAGAALTVAALLVMLARWRTAVPGPQSGSKDGITP
ncbi:MAG: glycosyltransferase family 4 protein [Alphaproteobacteria bacterium]